jgi:Fic family protein
VPALRATFSAWLAAAPDEPISAFAAHLSLVGIHPFNDGNGRTARLLMNLMLARAGYPPMAIRLEDKPAYLRSLEKAQSGGGDGDFHELLFLRLDQTLDIHLAAARQAQDVLAKATPTRT